MTNVLVCGMLPVHTYMNIGIRPVTYILARLVYVTRADTLVGSPSSPPRIEYYSPSMNIKDSMTNYIWNIQQYTNWQRNMCER